MKSLGDLSLEEWQAGQIILIDKPLRWTSFDAVKKVHYLIRKKFGVKKIKVGHAGTLDPLASGLLILCTGKFTKLIDTISVQEKAYTGHFVIGATTASYDLESPVENEMDWREVTPEMLLGEAKSMTGEQDQMPPIFSAKKVDGLRAYDAARSGRSIVLKTSRITISEFKIETSKLPEVPFEIVCSKGTYIRSMAHDFGEKLGIGAYLGSLRRTRIGDYSVDDAAGMVAFEESLSQ